MNILLADNETIFSAGLALLVKSLIITTRIERVYNWGDISESIKANMPDLILINSQLFGSLSWKYDFKHLTSENENTPFFLINNSKGSIDPQSAYQLGIKGIINKETSLVELEALILSAKKGRAFLKRKVTETTSLPLITNRQIEILKLLKGGASNKSIGFQLNLSEGTVKQHLSKIYKSLHAHNRVSAIGIAVQLGLI